MNPTIPPAAAWLGRRYRLCVLLRARRDRLSRRLLHTSDWATRVRLTRDLDRARARLRQMGDQN